MNKLTEEEQKVISTELYTQRKKVMTEYIKELLEYGFEEDSYYYYEEQYSCKYTLNLEGGELQWNLWENALYIWSGMGLGSYSTTQDFNVEDKSEYGDGVEIKSLEHLKRLLELLI